MVVEGMLLFKSMIARRRIGPDLNEFLWLHLISGTRTQCKVLSSVKIFQEYYRNNSLSSVCRRRLSLSYSDRTLVCDRQAETYTGP